MPPTISKQYFDAVSASSLSCFKVLHPSTSSCTKALFDFILNAAIGSSKFFLFIYTLLSRKLSYSFNKTDRTCFLIVLCVVDNAAFASSWYSPYTEIMSFFLCLLKSLQAISDRNKINGSYIKKTIRSYLRSLVFALCFGFNFHASLCLFRWCLNRFSFYAVALSGMCGGLAVLLRPQQDRSLDTAIFLNLVSETLLRYLYSESIIKRSFLKETILFMTCSAILMYLLKKLKPGARVANLWFYYPSQPKPLQNCGTKETCLHEKSCSVHFYEGFCNYFAVGYALQLIKYLLPRLTTILTDPAKIFQAFINKDKFLCGLLIGGYVGIYRIVSCALYRKNKSERSWHPLLAGLLAGVAYRFKPTVPVLAIAFTTILQLTVNRITYLNSHHANLPLREIIYAVCAGIIIHSRFFLPKACPSYVKNMLLTATNGRANKICEHAIHTLENLGKSAII